MNADTPARKKFVAHLLKQDPKLSEKETSFLLNSFKRFVKVVQRLYTEPQAQIIIKDQKVGDKIVRQRIITSDFEELQKVFDKSKPVQDLAESMRKLHKSITKDKYGR